MARPTRTNAEYFYHPATFRNDRRVKAIRARFGACGYGLLVMLIELLTDADNTALPTDEMEVELLAGDLSSTVEDVTALIQAAEKVGLFGRNEAGLLKCPQLDEWLAPVFDKRNRARNTATGPKLSQAVTETPITVTETPPVKESTGENSTEEERKEVLMPSSLRSEDAPAGAASEPEKKIEAELATESPDASASHTRGPADVGTRKARPHAYDPADIHPGLVLPFTSDTFRALWAGYRQYREENKLPRFNGGMQEQEALRHLSNLAADEYTAAAIISQTIRNGWKNLFKLDEPRPQYTAQDGTAGYGQRPASTLPANPFGRAQPESLAIARAVVVGSTGEYPGLI